MTAESPTEGLALTLPMIANAIYQALHNESPAGNVVAMLDGEEITRIEVPDDSDAEYPAPAATTWIELQVFNKVVTVNKVLSAGSDIIWMETDNQDRVFITFRPIASRLPLSSVINPFPAGN